MPTARSLQIDLNTTLFYHCYTRCVRRAKLFWENETGKVCLHRRDTIVNRLKLLASIFSIDICAYAIMQNHYHLVLRVNPTQAQGWSDEEVQERLKLLLPKKGQNATPEILSHWRERFYNISWFMRYLNEPIARAANKEDDVTGCFWESRFKSQALVDEGAILACMAYVDLNPIRANQAKTLETSDYTSIQERIQAYASQKATPSHLIDFQKNAEDTLKPILPFAYKDYLTLVEWTGRQLRDDKLGFIASDVPSLVKESQLNPDTWLSTVQYYNSPYQQIAGSLAALRHWATRIGQRWLKGQKVAKLRYLTAT